MLLLPCSKESWPDYIFYDDNLAHEVVVSHGRGLHVLAGQGGVVLPLGLVLLDEVVALGELARVFRDKTRGFQPRAHEQACCQPSHTCLALGFVAMAAKHGINMGDRDPLRPIARRGAPRL